MELRNYQLDAIDSIFEYFEVCDGNPLIVMPTGSGKSHVIAGFMSRVLECYAGERMIMLTHVKELIEQNVEKIYQHIPLAPLGIYSAGLNSKKTDQITAASIQSIYRNAFKMDPVSLILVDECHLIPRRGNGRYRQFIADMRKANPSVKVIGFTASPFRLDSGLLTDGDDALFTDIAYSADINQLIDQNYLTRLVTKAGTAEADLSGVHKLAGEFKSNELEAAMESGDLVSEAVAEIVQLCASRKSWLLFGAGVKHAQHIADELLKNGIVSACVHGETPAAERDHLLTQFKLGNIQAISNANLLTTGFDAPNIDALIMLRPTASAGLYLQMVGRALRTHPGKENALVLDYAGNVKRFGPIDTIDVTSGKSGDGDAPVKTCPACREIIHASVRLCPDCGYEFPPPEIKHAAKAAAAPILSTDKTPWSVDVKRVEVNRHEKKGKPPSLQVTYYGELERHREWICFEHAGYAGQKAAGWWKRRFDGPIPTTVLDAMTLFLADRLQAITKSIKVRQSGKYTEVVGAELRD